jgi:hypothetical protein
MRRMFLHGGYHQIEYALSGISAEEQRAGCEHRFVRMGHVCGSEVILRSLLSSTT